MASNGEQQTISPTSAFPGFSTSLKYVALVVVGEPLSEDYVEPIVKELAKGLKNWDIDAEEAEYEDVLKAVTTAEVKEIGLVHRSFSHAGSQLGIVVLINPTHQSVATELRELLLHPASHKHLIYGGSTVEVSGDWMLHDDIFTLTDISEIFSDPQVEAAVQKSGDEEKLNLVLSNCMWSTSVVTKQAFSKSLNLTINPPDSKHELEGITNFVNFVKSQIVIPNPFQLLEPPTMGVGVKCKITKPTVLVFPAANGDCGFFAVGDFSIFIGGGYCTKSCFWKFAKHLNRVDAILVPHMNPNCLFGVNSFLQRKLSETQLEQPEQDSDGFEDWQTKCNSPELGVVYLNAPATKKSPTQSLVLKSFAVGSQTVKLSKELGCDPIACCAGTGKVLEPITLFQKVGIGRLDMFVLSPTQNSKELKDFFTQWSSGKAFTKVKTGVKVNDKDAELSLLDAISICALIVWQPWNPEEDIVRVLFPGNAPQNKILEGLDKVKHLDYLKYRDVSKRSLANGGKAVPRKKPGTGSAKSTPKANGPVKKSPSPTKEENICEDGIHCNTPPPSPTDTSSDGIHNIPAKGEGEPKEFVPVGKCEDGVHCNTPPPDEESAHSFVPIGKCEDGEHCNTPPPEDGVCSDGVHCNTPPPEEENDKDMKIVAKCEDGIHCNTPPPEDGVCSDGVHCNTPPPEEENDEDLNVAGKCEDGLNCNTPPPEEGFVPIDKCEDGIHCNTPPPEDGVCSDGVHCNTPPPEEEANSAFDTEASADPVEHQEVDVDTSAGLEEHFLNVKDSDQPTDESKDDQGDLDGANSSGHGTAAATPEQVESPLEPSGGFGDGVDQEDPLDEQQQEVTDANHNLELTFGGASPDLVHDSSGIDTEESPSPDQQRSWDPQVEPSTDLSPLLPPDVVTDHEVGGSGDLQEIQSGNTPYAEVTSDAVVEEVAEGEEHEESSEDVSQASEIEVKPSSLSDESPPVVQDTPTELEQKDDMESFMQETTEMDTNIEGEAATEEKDEIAFEGQVEVDQNVGESQPVGEFDLTMHATAASDEVETKFEETEEIQQDVVMEEAQPEVELDLLQSTEGEPVEGEQTQQEEDFEKMEVTSENAEPGLPVEVMDEIQQDDQGDLMQTSSDDQENVEHELKQEAEMQEMESEGTNVDQQQQPLQVDTPFEQELEKEDEFGAQHDEGEKQTEEEEEQQLEADIPAKEIPPEAVFDDFSEEKGEIEDDSLEARFETEDDSLEVKVGTTDDHSVDEISEDKDAYQEKETVMVADDSFKEQEEIIDELAHQVPEQHKEEEEAQEEDSLEVGAKEQSDSQDPLSEEPVQEEVSVEEVSREEHSIEEDKSRELEEENIGSDQIQIEVQSPEQQESESTPLSEEFEQNVSPELESIPMQGSSGEDQNLVDICIESAPAAVDVNMYPADKPQGQKEGEEDAPNSEIERFFAPPEPRLLHDDHPITESQNTSDGVMEIEDVSAASEEIPAEVVTSEESPPLAAPVVVPDIPPVSVPAPPVKESSEGEAVEKPKQSHKKTEVKKTTKLGKSDVKKSGEVKAKMTKTTKVEKPGRMSLTGRSTTTTTKKSTEKKSSETKTGTSRKSLEKKTTVKKIPPPSEKKNEVNGTKKSTPVEKKTTGIKSASRLSTGARTEAKKPLASAKTTTKKTEAQRPGPSGKPNGPTRRSLETTTKRTTVKTTRVTSARGDSKTNGVRKSQSATTKGSTAAKSQSIPSSGPAVYVDLTYIPNHGAAENVNSEFFRRIRAKNYVMSGNNKSKKQPNIAVLEALLDGKMKWEDAGEKATLIPTHDVDCIREWQLTKQQEIDKANIEIAVPATRSIVQMKDENFFMYKVEFDQNGSD
ncbi:Microtubule-associated protein 1B [Holothuria leucospilota]|uniref:Microtubule-associated protein 1B n=1 Tax=Holothuria leucospilota TaxID=206669 RepID=A0A9Q1BMY6_HOLLE|nr:Microtubule-associated protein 1B [Holothuria leucospilota]